MSHTHTLLPREGNKLGHIQLAAFTFKVPSKSLLTFQCHWREKFNSILTVYMFVSFYNVSTTFSLFTSCCLVLSSSVFSTQEACPPRNLAGQKMIYATNKQQKASANSKKFQQIAQLAKTNMLQNYQNHATVHLTTYQVRR